MMVPFVVLIVPLNMSLNKFIALKWGIFRTKQKNITFKKFLPEYKNPSTPMVSRGLLFNTCSGTARAPMDALAYGTYPTRFLSPQ